MISIDQFNVHSKSNHEIGVYTIHCIAGNVFCLFLEDPQMKKRLKLFQNGCLPSLWSPCRACLSQCLSDKMIVQKRFSARMRLPTFGKVLPPPLFNLQLNREKTILRGFPDTSRGYHCGWEVTQSKLCVAVSFFALIRFINFC